MRYRVPGGLAAIAVAVAVLSGGCSNATGPAAAPQVEKHNLTVAAVPVADSAALYIAQQRGLFQAAGLNVKIVTVVSGATAIAGQLAGKYDAVLGNYVSYILANAHRGNPFRVLAPASAEGPNDSMLLVAPGSSIQSVAQLRGKTIGVNAPNNIGTLLITSLLSDNGLQAQTDHVRFKAVPFPDMTHQLLTHQIDAAWMVEPFVTFAEMSGAQVLADTNTGATQDLPIAGYMVTKSWEQKYPGTAAALRQVLRQGQQVAASNAPAVTAGLEKFAGIPASAAQIIALPSFPMTVQ